MLNDLKSDSEKYQLFHQSAMNRSSLESGNEADLLKELNLLENTLVLLARTKSVKLHETAVTAQKHMSAIEQGIQDVCDLDYRMEGIDTHLSDVMRLIDATTSEINHLRGSASTEANNDEVHLSNDRKHKQQQQQSAAVERITTATTTTQHSDLNNITAADEDNSNSFNIMSPLFDNVDIDLTSRIATINNCRMSYRSQSDRNLNYNEINLAYVNLTVAVLCLRNLYGFTSNSSAGASKTSDNDGGVTSSKKDTSPASASSTATSDHIDCSMYTDKSYAVQFVRHFEASLDSSVTKAAVAGCERLYTTILEGSRARLLSAAVSSSAVPEKVISSSLIKLRPFKSRVLLLLTSTVATSTVAHHADNSKRSTVSPPPSPGDNNSSGGGQERTVVKRKIKEWLYLEGGVGAEERRSRHAYRLRLIQKQKTLQAAKRSGTSSGSGSGMDTSGYLGGGLALLTQSVLPIFASGSSTISEAFQSYRAGGGAGAGAAATAAESPRRGSKATDSGGDAVSQSAKRVSVKVSECDEEEDDSEYRRALLALVSVIAVTCLQALLARHKISSSKLRANSGVYNFNIFSSFIATHFVGSSRGVAYALLLGVRVGFEDKIITAERAPLVVGGEGERHSDSSYEEQEGDDDGEEEDSVFIVPSRQQQERSGMSSRSGDSSSQSLHGSRNSSCAAAGNSSSIHLASGVGATASLAVVPSLYGTGSNTTYADLEQLLCDSIATFRHLCSLH